MKTKIAISIGDINGIGIEIALKAHSTISKFCKPLYFVHSKLLVKACEMLGAKIPKGFQIVEFSHSKKINFTKHAEISHFSADISCEFSDDFDIEPGCINANSGAYSFASFKAACEFVWMGFAKALITLPIHKKAWSEAGIAHRGHTQALRELFGHDAIMMLGCKKCFVALFTEHVPLREVSEKIQIPALCEFFINFYRESKFKKIGVLAFNPHASDFGAIGGEEEEKISATIKIVNFYLSFISFSAQKRAEILGEKMEDKILLERLINDKNFAAKCEKKVHVRHFYLPNPLVADTAFTPNALKYCNRLVSMSHDVALAPLKALFFDKSVNVSLNLPIVRTSVDHGTAFDKAYARFRGLKNAKISTKSYVEAVKVAVNLVEKRDLRLNSAKA